MKSIKAIFRRGQTSTKLDGQIHTPEDLSRSSSVTNLNVPEQPTPKAKTGTVKPRKSSSRDRLDKLVSGTGTAERKNDRKGLSKNNNKFEASDQSLTLDTLQEIESLKSQLHQMATEKSTLALKLGEQKGQIHSLQHQIENLKMFQEQSSIQLEQLTEENTALRNRLRDVAHSPLSDNEKQQLLYESHRHHNSAPASIATNPMEDGTCGDITACPTPDWDKHSSSNVSEVSVACLQDKINQMQETHYSTNEELQATLQELTDLQRQLTELQQENERLVEEKNLMFDSLCRQTERLKDTRQEVESLKTLLYREKDETGLETAQEREEKLVDLLKSAQDEHESLLSKHEQLSGELQELRQANDVLHDQLKVVTERNGTLESTLDAKHAEHKLLDQELAQARDQCNGKQIEVNRLKDLLENARTKINELEQDRAMSDKSELDEMLDNARKEKDSLESEVAHLKEQLARSKNEVDKLKEQISILQEECKVTRNNARTIQSDLEYKYEKLAQEKAALAEQLHKFQDIINELQVQAQCQEEDKRNLSDVLAETQRNLSESERKIVMLENDLADVKKLRKEENEEWEKFQNDLLTSVRVANDFKTEAQQDLQKMIMENKEHRDKVRQLEAQLDKLKGDPAMPEERRNSQPFPKESGQRRIFGSLPNLLDTLGDKEHKGSKRPKWMRHQKHLSQGEEKILESLNKMYDEIDPKKPDSMLTSEQAVVKKLKTLYEDDSTKYKPVAPRNKQELAISKPLLESVYSNPKLESIARNPNLRSLENDRFSWMGHKRFSDDLTDAKGKKDSKFHKDQTTKFVSYLLDPPEVPPRPSTSQHNRESSDNSKVFPLRRYSSKEDLTGIAELESFRSPGKRSSLKSVPSDTSSNISNKKRVSFDEQRNSCVVIKEFLSFESLEDIYKTIDHEKPEEQLTKEQRFALRLKTSMQNLGRKPELRKRPTFKRSKVTISSPLKDSVLKNTKLFSIIKDPIVRTAGEDTEQEIVELRKVHRMKKYLAGMNRVLRNPSRRKKDSRLSRSLENLSCFPYAFKRISSSMENLPSEGGIEPKIEIKVVTKVLPEKTFAAPFNVSSSSSSMDNSSEDLIGNSEETPVVFIEHFESENGSRSSKQCSVLGDTGVHIQDVSEDCNSRRSGSMDDEYTGRISFPEEETEVCRMRLLSINSVEMEEEDEVLARYKRISEFKEENSDRESFEENKREEDSHSFYSVELTNLADDADRIESPVSQVDQENWLDQYLDQTCDIEERKENRKMRGLYKDVVQEIKRKYSQDLQGSSESSEDEDVHIFNTKEGRIEVRRVSEDEDREDNFFERFFKSNHQFSFRNEQGTNVEGLGKSEDEKKSFSVLHPTVEEMEYIKHVREEYKDEFEDVDRLGNTDVESDYYKKFLCRQNAIDHSVIDSRPNEDLHKSETASESFNLSINEKELLSSARKRLSRPLSDINMDDILFIESMKDKYLNKADDACQKDTKLEISSKDNPISNIPSYSYYYLKYSTEYFLDKEINHNMNYIPEANCTKRITTEEPEQKPVNNTSTGTTNSTSYSDNYLKYLTEIFLNGEIKYSEGNNSTYTTRHRSCSTENRILPEDLTPTASNDYSTSYNDDYLKYSTSNFLTEEIEKNTFWNKSFKILEKHQTEDEARTTSKYSPGSIIVDQSVPRVGTEDLEQENDEQKDVKIPEYFKEPIGSEFTSRTEIILRNSEKSLRTSTDCNSWLYYEPVYANASGLSRQDTKKFQIKPRKPRPLPRKASTDARSNITTIHSVTGTFDNVSLVKIKNEPHEELLPNSSKVMDESKDDLRKTLQEPSAGSLAKRIDSICSSNVMVRKTKKFIKDGDQVEEFDEATGVYNVRLDNVIDNDKFDTKSQVIPEALIDYADSESKVTLFDADTAVLSDFQESCSRPQTSRQRSTPFRLSYYGESSEEGVDNLKEATPRTSKENVTRLKQKFENLVSENDEPDRNSVAQKANLAKLLNEKAAYDLVFKTDSKHWFDNSSEMDRPESSIQTASPSFEPSSSEKPLNITILDPIESRTNANYQHLFESDARNKTPQKPYLGNLKLSELNLKTSIPCVDFTTLNNPMVERESNASLYNFALASGGSSGADAATCATKDE